MQSVEWIERCRTMNNEELLHFFPMKKEQRVCFVEVGCVCMYVYMCISLMCILNIFLGEGLKSDFVQRNQISCLIIFPVSLYCQWTIINRKHCLLHFAMKESIASLVVINPSFIFLWWVTVARLYVELLMDGNKRRVSCIQASCLLLREVIPLLHVEVCLPIWTW